MIRKTSPSKAATGRGLTLDKDGVNPRVSYGRKISDVPKSALIFDS